MPMTGDIIFEGFIPPVLAVSDIYWERDCDCWKDVATQADAEAVFSVGMQCWISVEEEDAACIPDNQSVPKPFWDTDVDDWVD